jgi:O-antigen ligase
VRLLAEQPFTGFGYNAVWSAFENRLSQYPDAPGPSYAHAHNAWLDWALQLGLGGWLLYIVFLVVLAKRALMRAWKGDVAVGVQAMCMLVYVQIYDLANVSTVPITRFGFFMLAVVSACLWLGEARDRREADTAATGGTG